MNPLSTWTYLSRHKKHTALLLSLSIIVTIALFSMVAMVWGVFVEPARLAYKSFSKFSMVTPWPDQTGSDSEVITRIKANLDVARVLPTTVIRIQLPSAIEGSGFQFDLFGLTAENLPYILARFDASLKDGRLPEPGMNEILLSVDVANMLGLKVGDLYEVVSSEFYINVDVPLKPTPFDVVGILESEVELGIVSLEYLRSHELYQKFPARYLVVADENRDSAVDTFLRNDIQNINTSVMTLSQLNERVIKDALPGLVMLLPVILIVATAFSFLIVVVNQIANGRRLPEFGILHAAGRRMSYLIRRLTSETGTLAVMGWVIANGLSLGFMYLLKSVVFAPQGHDFNYPVWLPIVFTIPVPLVVAGFTFFTIRRTFARLDPVTIIEQGELSKEGERKRAKPASKSSHNPLAPVIFYKRHRRRASLLIGGMGVMILAVVLIIFVLGVDADAKIPFSGYLHQVSILRLQGGTAGFEPDLVARVQTHPTVGRVLPFAPRISMLSVYIPPFTSAEASPFAVYAEGMTYLVDLYGLELKEGHLPRTGTNEMVIPEALAQNRKLEVGDAIGDPNRPAYPGAPSLPVEFVVSGIFSRCKAPEAENGWGFISLEFLEDHGPFPLPDVLPLIIVPKLGQKAAMEDWLEAELAGEEVSVLTYSREVDRIRQKAQQDMLSIAMLEGVIAIVAGIGLAVLNFIFTAQRQSEFGVLYALGHSRGQLVGRVLGEVTFVTVMAWALSAIVALMAMVAMRYGVYEPRGLSFDLINLTPWLYTLPIPVFVLAITAGSTAYILSKLDPISIIERRA